LEIDKMENGKWKMKKWQKRWTMVLFDCGGVFKTT